MIAQPQARFQLTHFEPDLNLIESSVYGQNIPYLRWCQAEAQRLQTRGVPAWVARKGATRKIAVFRDMVGVRMEAQEL